MAQINARVGDPSGNAARVLTAAAQAHALGAHVLVTPELVLPGYPPEDLILRPFFLDEQDRVLAELTQSLAIHPGLHVVVGHVQRDAGAHFNAVSVLCDGECIAVYRKRELPNYAVFDERRYFTPDGQARVFEVNGVRLGLNICEDIWFEQAPRDAAAAGAQVLLVPNASPFAQGKHARREGVARHCAEVSNCAVIYANLVGGQDELVFDGASFAVDRQGHVVARLPDYVEGVNVVQADDQGHVVPISEQARMPVTSSEAQVYQALVVGVRDYLGKNGFRQAILGLSGGIDSALVLAIAVDAIGAENVRAVMMPSRYTADMSQTDAAQMARTLGVRYDTLSIAPIVEAIESTLAEQFDGLPIDATEENIQARARGTLLMALSNKTGAIVLTTGNKSEMATGYCTLYGDMAGGFAVIKDVLKTLVYRLSVWRNREGEVIPQRIITRAPSAELRPDQTDQDSLPPYEVLDAIIERYMEHDMPAADIVAAGYDAEAVAQVIRLLRINEYKRRQAPPGPRVTERAFGRDWRYPVSNGFRELI